MRMQGSFPEAMVRLGLHRGLRLAPRAVGCGALKPTTEPGRLSESESQLNC